MRNSAKTLLVSFSIAAAAAAFALPAANAAVNNGDSKFKLFEATPKAERVEAKEATPKAERIEPDTNRQIVVEPRQKTPVATLNPVIDEVEPTPQKEFSKPQKEAAAKPKQKPETTEQPEVTEKPEADEDVFAPQKKTEEEKVEMPTVFTEKQKKLFEALGADEQKTLVAKLIKKYGYDSMYPKNVTRKYAEDYKAKQSHRSYGDHYSYNDDSYTGGYNSYSSGYGSGYTNCQ